MDYRSELKFVCSGEKMHLMEDALRLICGPDPHAGSTGRYMVKSLYFDTPDMRCYYQAKDGVDNRAKYRIRIYDCSDEYICLERKESLRGKKRKIQERISRQVYDEIFDGAPNGGELLSRFLTGRDVFLLEPKAVICYDRTPLIHPAGNVRITFDRNISAYSGDLFSGGVGLSVMSGDMGVVEVKYDEVLPGAIADCLRAYDIKASSFSKYVHGIDALSGIVIGG